MTAPHDPAGTPAPQRFLDPEILRSHMLHGRESIPTRRVWRGDHRPRHLPSDPHDLDSLPISLPDGRSVTLQEFLAASESNAILVLRRGTVVYERYLHAMQPHDVHVTASMTKSLIGLIAVTLIRNGLLARDRPLHGYVPELAGTAFGDATIQDLLHMGTQVRYGGRPFVKEREAQRYFAVVGIVPRPAGYEGPTTIMEHLATAQAEGPGGAIFRYENGNTEALGEAIRRITGTSLADLLSELLWSRIGADEDAHFALDSSGREIACGQFSATLRDLARIGEMLRCRGALGQRQVLPEEVVANITAVPDGPAGDVLGSGDARDSHGTPIMGYHDYWWIPYGHDGSFLARGRSGQRLYVCPSRETVIAHYGSHAVAPTVPVPRYESVFQQIGAHLGENAHR